MPGDTESLFLQFRRTRDPAVLGEVFDLCADDLFAVALHLANDRAAAEDIVQSTFLVAIERADRWQAGRALRPWLLGILHREAKVQRRRARRQVDEQRLPARSEPAPPQGALDAEARQAVAAALQGMPMPYREVVALHVEQALPPAAIAEHLQRSPGAVRTQLWRGLELLRAMLPKGLAIGLVAQLTANAPLAAVRARVLGAAATRVAGLAGGAVVVSGALMKKLLAAVVLLLVGVVAWMAKPEGTTAAQEPRREGVAGVSASLAAPHLDAAPAPGEALARVAARDATLPLAANAEPVAELPPVVLPVLVVDAAGDPVPEAMVQRFEQAMRTGEDGKSEPAGRRARATADAQVRTNSLGRTQLTIDGPCLVSADKQGIGWSGDHHLERRTSNLPAELRLVLLPTTTVRGVVRLPDGEPAVGATIDAWMASVKRELSGSVPVSPSDERGAFTMVLLAGEDHYLRARLGERFTAPRSLSGKAAETVVVELQFPGAFSVRGTLRDHEGQPVRGRVHLHAPPIDTVHGGDWSAECDAEGRFEILLAEGGSFDLVAGVVGQTSAQQRLVLDAASPHARVELRTAPFVPVEGRIVDEHDRPLEGVFVGLSYVVERDSVHELRSNLHGILPRGPSDAQGAFRFLAPAGYRYQVGVRPLAGNHSLFLKGPVAAAPATGLVVVVRDVDRQGFVVVGRVVADASGAPVPEGHVARITYEAGSASQGAHDRFVDGAFRVGPLPAGERIAIEVKADGFARALVGPFDTTVRTEEVVVRLQRCGVVRCRVLRADGTPAVKAWACMQNMVEDPFAPAWQGETDADGCIEFRAVTPGNFKVHAGSAGTHVPGGSVEAIVRPEQTSEVRIALPR